MEMLEELLPAQYHLGVMSTGCPENWCVCVEYFKFGVSQDEMECETLATRGKDCIFEHLENASGFQPHICIQMLQNERAVRA